MKKFSKIIIIILFTHSLSSAQIILDGVGNYTEDFDTLASSGTSSTVPNGWAFFESGTSGNTTYSAGTGSNNTGDTYSFGATSSTERAFGGLQSGTLIPTIGASFTNNTGFTITQIPITYTGEQWRLGTRGRFDRIDFQYSLDATSLTTGTWIDVDNLDFITPDTSGIAGLRDGNSASYRTNIAYTITALNLSTGSTLWIRWNSFDASGADDGLAIDDFSIDETNLPVELSSFSAIILDKGVKLNWRTETEVNNYGFEILRAHTSTPLSVTEWDVIGFVVGHGNSNSPKEYSFIDDLTLTPNLNHTLRYRLKQIDTDGQFEYSKTIVVELGSPQKFQLSQNYPNPFNPSTTISFSLPQSGYVKLTVYNIIGEQVAELSNEFKEAGIHTINFDASDFNSGVYFYQLKTEGFSEIKKMILVK